MGAQLFSNLTVKTNTPLLKATHNGVTSYVHGEAKKVAVSFVILVKSALLTVVAESTVVYGRPPRI